ncbi:MAG: hypothetical protein KDD65_15640 [Bacteroidetes bacterium]|nr:hypothetical protein [Bacteroidota bacterium]
MKRSAAILVIPIVLVAGCGLWERGDIALEISDQFDGMATQNLWPGFQPDSIPLAIFDGKRTWLFHHPAPPATFSGMVRDRPDVRFMEGRQDAVTSNSSADIGGVSTATLLADGDRSGAGASDLAATAMHEAFHVFQRAQHPSWVANEGNLFLYPTDSPDLLTLRRLETEALRKAVDDGTVIGSECWSRTALQYRTDRYAAMDSVFSAYERKGELNEGLATYVQQEAKGEHTVSFPNGGFPATDVRERLYKSGAALGILLDRLRPGWKSSLERDDQRWLDVMLGGVVGLGGEVIGETCTLDANTVDAVTTKAEEDAAAVVEVRKALADAFNSMDGWRVSIEAAVGNPLWPQGFDPLNVERIEDGVLHTRFLKLGNDSGSLEMLDDGMSHPEAVTVAAGDHPLFNGVREVVVAGLHEPTVETRADSVLVEANGFHAAFAGAEVDRDDWRVTIRIR